MPSWPGGPEPTGCCCCARSAAAARQRPAPHADGSSSAWHRASGYGPGGAGRSGQASSPAAVRPPGAARGSRLRSLAMSGRPGRCQRRARGDCWRPRSGDAGTGSARCGTRRWRECPVPCGSPRAACGRPAAECAVAGPRHRPAARTRHRAGERDLTREPRGSPRRTIAGRRGACPAAASPRAPVPCQVPPRSRRAPIAGAHATRPPRHAARQQHITNSERNSHQQRITV